MNQSLFNFLFGDAEHIDATFFKIWEIFSVFFLNEAKVFFSSIQRNLSTVFFFAWHEASYDHVFMNIVKLKATVQLGSFHWNIQVALFNALNNFTNKEFTLIIHSKIVFFTCDFSGISDSHECLFVSGKICNHELSVRAIFADTC